MERKFTWLRVVVVGAGNLAWSLLPALSKALPLPLELWGRHRDTAQPLLARCRATWHPLPPSIWEEPAPVPTSSSPESPATIAPGSLYVVCLPDTMLPRSMAALDCQNSLVIHCSGATPLIELKQAHSAVLYPLQTFTKGRQIDFSHLPLYVEGSSEKALQEVSAIAHGLSSRVAVCPTPQRLKLHIIGVLTNNFITHLLTLTAAYCAKCHIEENAYLPLLQETLDKIKTMPPHLAQTGPARRNDQQTLCAHQVLLASVMPSLLPVYNALSESILNLYHPRRHDAPRDPSTN